MKFAEGVDDVTPKNSPFNVLFLLICFLNFAKNSFDTKPAVVLFWPSVLQRIYRNRHFLLNITASIIMSNKVVAIPSVHNIYLETEFYWQQWNMPRSDSIQIVNSERSDIYCKQFCQQYELWYPGMRCFPQGRKSEINYL